MQKTQRNNRKRNTTAAIHRLRGILKPSRFDEWVEHKKQERELEEAKLVRWLK